MTFSYSLANDIGMVRFELGDTTSGSGVRADGSNLSDEEIQLLLTREGSVFGAAAGACEMLARDWAKVSNISIGSRSEGLSKVSAEWSARAVELRNSIGGNFAVFAIGAKREDGFSDYADGDIQ